MPLYGLWAACVQGGWNNCCLGLFFCKPALWCRALSLPQLLRKLLGTVMPPLEAVLYPGLTSQPGHEIAVRQMKDGFGGMLSLLIENGEKAALIGSGQFGAAVSRD